MAKRNNKKEYKTKTLILIISILGLLLFVRSSGFDFVWDDNPLYLNKVNYPTKNEFANFQKFWSPTAMPMFAPVTYSVWAVISSVSSPTTTNVLGKSPFLFHLINILIHIFNSILVFLIIKLIIKNRLASFGASLIFLLHPLAVESVSWISELRGLLSAFFGFTAIYLFFKYYYLSEQKHDSRIDIGITVLLILSFLSKPIGIVFPLIIVVAELFNDKLQLIEKIKRTILPVILMLVFLVVAINSESDAAKVLSSSAQTRLLLPLFGFIFYLIKFLIPFNLSAVYGLTPDYLSSSLLIFIYPLIFLILISLAIIFRNKYKIAVFGIIIAFAAGLPTSGLIPFYYQTFSSVADRYFYIPMLGIAIIAGYLLLKINSEKTMMSVIAVITIVLSFITYNQQSNWQSEISHWNNIINKSQIGIPQAYMGRGEALISQGKYNEAIADFSEAIKINPKEGLYYYNRANSYLDLKQYNRAIEDYTESITLNPNHINSYVNRGMAYSEINDFNKAISDFKSAIKLNPNQSDALNYIGVVFAQSSRFDSAVVYFRKALDVSPSDEQAAENLKMATEELSKGQSK